MTAAAARAAGRPRNPELDSAILAAAEQQFRELGYARMSLEAVAVAAGTSVPSVRRRFRSKAGLAGAVIGSLRIADMPTAAGPPRARALAILTNFHDNLQRPGSLAVVGTLLAEEQRHPELLGLFRSRLVEPRRVRLRQALAEPIRPRSVRCCDGCTTRHHHRCRRSRRMVCRSPGCCRAASPTGSLNWPRSLRDCLPRHPSSG
jgi:AcrR family transcriptional regulator